MYSIFILLAIYVARRDLKRKASRHLLSVISSNPHCMKQINKEEELYIIATSIMDKRHVLIYLVLKNQKPHSS